MIDSTKLLQCMSRKAVFKKTAKIQRSCVTLCGRMTFVQPTPALTTTIIDKITIFQRCKQNATFPAVELVINILNIMRYFVIKK